MPTVRRLARTASWSVAPHRAIAPSKIAKAVALQKRVFGGEREPDWLYRQCQRIAQALNKGEIALAQIYGLRIPLDRSDASQLTRTALAKAGFNSDEPRIPKGDPRGGEWTTGGGPTEAPASTNLLADRVDNQDNDPGIKWEMKPIPSVPPSTTPSTLDSPDLTNDAADADYGGGSDETSDNDAIYPDYTFENLLFLLGTRGLSGVASPLARALIRAGISRGANSDTHHIVAQQAQRADPARKILQRFGIGLDDSKNGIFLPRQQHQALHSKTYYDAVNDALAGATTKAEAEEILRSIARQLEAGTFP